MHDRSARCVHYCSVNKNITDISYHILCLAAFTRPEVQDLFSKQSRVGLQVLSDDGESMQCQRDDHHRVREMASMWFNRSYLAEEEEGSFVGVRQFASLRP